MEKEKGREAISVAITFWGLFGERIMVTSTAATTFPSVVSVGKLHGLHPRHVTKFHGVQVYSGFQNKYSVHGSRYRCFAETTPSTLKRLRTTSARAELPSNGPPSISDS